MHTEKEKGRKEFFLIAFFKKNIIDTSKEKTKVAKTEQERLLWNPEIRKFML